MPRYRFYLPNDIETFEDLPDDEAACYEAAAIARDLGRARGVAGCVEVTKDDGSVVLDVPTSMLLRADVVIE